MGAGGGPPVDCPVSKRSPGFIRLQNRLGAHDLLNEYIRHIGSAIFAVPPAPEKGQYIGQSLFS